MISIIVFIIEIIIHKTSLAAIVTKDRLEVGYQDGEEPSLTVRKIKVKYDFKLYFIVYKNIYIWILGVTVVLTISRADRMSRMF